MTYPKTVWCRHSHRDALGWRSKGNSQPKVQSERVLVNMITRAMTL